VDRSCKASLAFNVCRLWANGLHGRDDGEERHREIHIYIQSRRVLSLSARLKYQKGPAPFSLIIVLLFHSESFKHRTHTLKTLKDLFATDLNSCWVKISTKGDKEIKVKTCPGCFHPKNSTCPAKKVVSFLNKSPQANF
jgi:hypothetical protein